MSSGQIAIPDLDDEEVFNLPKLPQSNGLGGGLVSNASVDDLPGPSRPWMTHGRTGSGTSAGSSIGESSSMAASQNKIHGAPSSAPWAFPRKGSFASLKAAFKGGASAGPSQPNGQAGHAATTSIEQTPAASFRNLARTTGPASKAQAEGSQLRRQAPQNHGRSESQLSLQSKSYATSSSIPRGHHTHHPSQFSEASNGAASSSSSHAASLPPVPPFPNHLHHPGAASVLPSRQERSQTSLGHDQTNGDGYFGSTQPGLLDSGGSDGYSNPAAVPSTKSNAGFSTLANFNSLMASDPTSAGQGTLPAGIGASNPRTPSEFALNVLMSRFLARTRTKVRAVLDHGMDAEPLLEPAFGPQADEDFEALLASLAHVSKNNSKLVVESLFSWHAMHLDEAVDAESVRRAMSEAALAAPQAGTTSGIGVKDVAAILGRRRTLICSFILARSLMEVAKQLTPGSLPERSLDSLLTNVFELLQNCSLTRMTRSPMQAATFDKVAQLLGELSRKYFVSVGDRFISMLEHCSKAPASKNVELAQETAVRGMRYLVITVFPMELFEEGAEFVDTMARFFASAHGHAVKAAYAETLTHLLLPVAKSASAEINHPTWQKAIEAIAPRAHAMASKPRYWNVAFPLYVATLCSSAEEQFVGGYGTLPGWSATLESAVARLKDRSARPIVLNAALRLIWVYMFRCRDSSTTTSKRLEAFFRQWFPPLRSSVLGAESSMAPHVRMVHWALYRHFDFGRDLILDFLRYNLLSGSTLSLQPEYLHPQRMMVGIRAILLTLESYVKTESPELPSNPDFSQYENDSNKALGEELAEDFTYPTPEIGEAQAKFNDLIGKIALICDHQVGSASVFDGSCTIVRGALLAHVGAAQDQEKQVMKQHPGGRLTVAYLRDLQPAMDLLRACFESWPRCLSSSIAFASVLAVLFRAHFNADPHLGEAASQALRRIAKQRKGGAAAIVSGFGRAIFRSETIFWETHPYQVSLLFKVEAAVKVWMEFLNIWLNQLRSSQVNEQGVDSKMERTSAWAINDEVEAYGLLLLCSGHKPLRRQAVGILRLVSVLDDAFSDNKGNSKDSSDPEPSRVIHVLDQACSDYCHVENPQMSADQRQKVQEWIRYNSARPLSDLAESDVEIEHSLWQLVLPRFLRTCLACFPTTVAVFRSHTTNRFLSMEAAVAIAGGLVPRAATTVHATTRSIPASSGLAATPLATGTYADQMLMAQHWKFYIIALCTTTTSTEGSRGAAKASISHQRSGSDTASTERVVAARDLFQKLVPFLASDQTSFREAVVVALGNINANLYRTLLETLQPLSSQLNDGSKGRGFDRALAPFRQRARLRTALAQVYRLTSSHMSGDQAFGDSYTMTLILNWLKDTFNFLVDPDVKEDWDFQRLRRLFCGVIDDLYSGLTPRGECDRYFPFETRLRMFISCADWYSFSQSAKDGPAKLANLLAGVAEQCHDEKQREDIINSLRNETQSLSFQASDAMATLCHGPLVKAGTTTAGTPFDGPWLTKWLEGLFRSPSPINHAVAKRALRSLLQTNAANEGLITALLSSCFNEPDHAVGVRSLFACFSDTVTAPESSAEIALHRVFCLGLTKLGHPDPDIRRKAFALIDWAARKKRPDLSLYDVEIGISSPLPATYLRAQRDVSAHLSHHFSQSKIAMVCEYTMRLESIDSLRRSTTLGLLPDWLRDIDLLQGAESAGGGNVLTHCAVMVLTNLFSMTVRFGDEHNFEIQDAWASLAEGAQVLFNANAICKFLIDESLCFRSPMFILQAKRVVSCLSRTVIGPHIFDELCAFIEPTSMIPVPKEAMAVQQGSRADMQLYKAQVEALFPMPSSAMVFSPGQLALLFIGELTYERSERLSSKLPVLLHSILVQIDSYIPFIQEQILATFEQLMRSLASMSAAVVGATGASSAKAQVEQIFSRKANGFWSHTDLEVTLDEQKTPKNMRSLLFEVFDVLDPLAPDLVDQWGNVALSWATAGPVRHIACRSFQAFRVMLPDATPMMLADMLGRLSNTISDPNLDIQSFSLEILHTLNALVRETESDRADLYLQTFWSALACLNTINEREYLVAIQLLDGLLDKLDIGNPDTVRKLKSKCPKDWEGDKGGIQTLVLRGLRSSVTSAASFDVLRRLAKVKDASLIDTSEDRLAFLFANALPWFLQATDSTAQTRDKGVLELAEDIAVLSEIEGKPDLARVSTSIAKSRFRTKDDLLRQGVNCLRTHYLPRLGPPLAVNLLGLTLNQHDWLRSQTMQLLKIFFQAVDTRSREFANLGSELLMPLLRLLSTPLASQALEVLDEPITVRGGPAANQILRMSLQWGKSSRRREQANDTSIFGAPDDSGWAVANAQEMTSKTRINIQAVFKDSELTLDVAPVAMVDFVNDDYYDGSLADYVASVVVPEDRGTLDDLVTQLHDLSAFFAEDTALPTATQIPMSTLPSAGNVFGEPLAGPGPNTEMDHDGPYEPEYAANRRAQNRSASQDSARPTGNNGQMISGLGGAPEDEDALDTDDEEYQLSASVHQPALSDATSVPRQRNGSQGRNVGPVSESSEGLQSTPSRGAYAMQQSSPVDAFNPEHGYVKGTPTQAQPAYGHAPGASTTNSDGYDDGATPSHPTPSRPGGRGAGNRKSFFYRKAGPPLFAQQISTSPHGHILGNAAADPVGMLPASMSTSSSLGGGQGQSMSPSPSSSFGMASVPSIAAMPSRMPKGLAFAAAYDHQQLQHQPQHQYQYQHQQYP